MTCPSRDLHHIGQPPELSNSLLSLDRAALEFLAVAVERLLTPPVVSIVAKSGTGKTTFIEALIPELKGRHLQVGVLKHHGHATPFDTSGKDTFRLSQAGAAVIVGASAVQVAVFRQENGSNDLDDTAGVADLLLRWLE